jgi:hypothetical protein
MNNTTIIIRKHFAITLFQHSPLTRRVFYNNIKRERGQHYQHHLGTLIGISINHQKFFDHQHNTEAGSSSAEHGAGVASSSSSV